MASHPTKPNEQRRRLLKAASAAPVIFTLPVGSALAAGSVSCTADGMGNTIDTGVEIRGQNVFLNDEKLGNVNESFDIGSETYVVDDRGNLDPRLVTGSCWTSLITASAGSSTNIV